MKIDFQSYTPYFGGLKYKNGVKTKDALSPAIKDLLNKYSSDIKNMKNIDVMVIGNDEFKLCIKTPRFLDTKYERFYKEKKYEIKKDENNSSVELDKDPYKVDPYSVLGPYTLYKIMNKLTESSEAGVYDVACGYARLGSRGEFDWKSAPPIRTIEVAKLLDSVMQKIDDAENTYGMNCVKVFDNADEIARQQYRSSIINKIKTIYNTNDNFSKIDTRELETLLKFKDRVGGLKYYGINIDEKDWSQPVYIQDKIGYVDEIFNDYYNEFGFEIIRRFDGVIVKSPDSEYPQYFLKENGDKDYHISKNIYDGGCNLSRVDGDFEELVRLTEVLDNIAEYIDSSIGK